MQGKEKTDGVFSSDKPCNLYSLLEMPVLVFLCFILSGTSVAISSCFYHQFSRQPPMSGTLLCELNAKSDGLTCLLQLCSTAENFLKRSCTVHHLSFISFMCQSERFKQTLQKILLLQMETKENRLNHVEQRTDGTTKSNK